MAAGCSSQVARFNGVDDVFTASTNQRQIIPQANQPYPGDVSAAPVAANPSGSVSRGALPPPVVAGGALPPATADYPPMAPAPEPARTASAKPFSTRAPELDNSATGSTLKVPDAGARSAASKPFKEQPAKKPADAAVLPAKPKVKEGDATTQTASADTKAAKGTSKGGTYTVQSGDTLSKIAKATGVSTVALKQANGLSDGVIRIGQTLTVPAGGTATAATTAPVKADPVTTASTGPARTTKEEQVAAYTPPTKKAASVIDEDDGAAAPNATGIGKMRWPVRGRVISSYGKGGGKSNDGIDIAVPEGTAVKAAENGVVIYAGDGLKDFGNTVLVRHENGLVTVYGHANELMVTRGQKVKRGQEIATSGMSGNTTSPKLHFEVRKNSAPVDPSTFLE